MLVKHYCYGIMFNAIDFQRRREGRGRGRRRGIVQVGWKGRGMEEEKKSEGEENYHHHHHHRLVHELVDTDEERATRNPLCVTSLPHPLRSEDEGCRGKPLYYLLINASS